MSALEAMLVAQDAAAQGSLPDPTAHLELAGFAFPPSAGPSGEHRFLAHLKVGGEETECCGMVWQPCSLVTDGLVTDSLVTASYSMN